MAKKKVSSHGKGRMRKRVENVSSRRLGTKAYNAWHRGVKPKDIEGPFRGWLDYRSRKYRTVARVYKGMVYWFSPGGVLITVYEVPERFLEEYKP